MPGMTGTGPRGEGPRTGRGTGRCRPPEKKQKDDTQADAAEVRSDDVEPDWVPYVAVSDTAAIVEKAVKLGARVLIEPEGTNEPGAIAIIADPSGAVFAVQQF